MNTDSRTPPEGKDKPLSNQSIDRGDAIVSESSDAGEPNRPPEHGGPRGKEPTRYGDWERKGRCIDF